jgi:hypothetical protein
VQSSTHICSTQQALKKAFLVFSFPQGDFRRSHSETAIRAHERERLEKLVRYRARPAISDERVIIEGPQSIRVKLKSRWSDGTESLLFAPSEFLERLVELIPAPEFHTTRYYGVLASRSPQRGTAFQTHFQNRRAQV